MCCGTNPLFLGGDSEYVFARKKQVQFLFFFGSEVNLLTVHLLPSLLPDIFLKHFLFFFPFHLVIIIILLTHTISSENRAKKGTKSL